MVHGAWPVYMAYTLLRCMHVVKLCCRLTARPTDVPILRGAVQRYDHLFSANAKQGSFYLQSKVYRAKERIEEVCRSRGLGPSRWVV